MNIQKRDIALAIILSLITCGIYGIYWFIKITDDVKAVAEDNEGLSSGGLAFVFTLLTCGIYGIYWAYKIGELLKVAQQKNGVDVKDNAIVYLLLELFGLGIIVFALAQSELNTIVDKKGQA